MKGAISGQSIDIGVNDKIYYDTSINNESYAQCQQNKSAFLDAWETTILGAPST